MKLLYTEYLDNLDALGSGAIYLLIIILTSLTFFTFVRVVFINKIKTHKGAKVLLTILMACFTIALWIFIIIWGPKQTKVVKYREYLVEDVDSVSTDIFLKYKLKEIKGDNIWVLEPIDRIVDE